MHWFHCLWHWHLALAKVKLACLDLSLSRSCLLPSSSRRPLKWNSIVHHLFSLLVTRTRQWSPNPRTRLSLPELKRCWPSKVICVLFDFVLALFVSCRWIVPEFKLVLSFACYFFDLGNNSLFSSSEKGTDFTFAWVRNQLLHQGTAGIELAHCRWSAWNVVGVSARLVEAETTDV